MIDFIDGDGWVHFDLIGGAKRREVWIRLGDYLDLVHGCNSLEELRVRLLDFKANGIPESVKVAMAKRAGVGA